MVLSILMQVPSLTPLTVINVIHNRDHPLRIIKQLAINCKFLNGNLVCLPKKCVMLQLGHSNKHFKYNINNLVLPNVIEVKDLGIIVDHELKFKRHIQDNTTRAHSELHLY